MAIHLCKVMRLNASSGAYASCVTRWKWWSWQLRRKRYRFIRYCYCEIKTKYRHAVSRKIIQSPITVPRSQLMSFCWIEVWLQMKRLNLCTKKASHSTLSRYIVFPSTWSQSNMTYFCIQTYKRARSAAMRPSHCIFPAKRMKLFCIHISWTSHK